MRPRIQWCPWCEERTPSFGEARCCFCYGFKGWDAYYEDDAELRVQGPSNKCNYGPERKD